MADTSSVDVILDFLRRNHFTRAETALRSELSNHPNLNGSLKNLTLEDKLLGKVLEEVNGSKPGSDFQGLGTCNNCEVSNELIIKEIECGTGRNGPKTTWRNSALVGDWSGKPNEVAAIDSDDTVLGLYSRSVNACNGHSFDVHQNDGGSHDNNTSEAIAKSGEEITFSGEQRSLWLGSTSNAKAKSNYETIPTSEAKELDHKLRTSIAYSLDNSWPRIEEATSFANPCKDYSIKTVFPFPKEDVSTSYDMNSGFNKKECKKKTNMGDVRGVIKEQVDEVGRALYFGKSQGNTEQTNLSGLNFSLAPDSPKEEFPRLPPVKLKSEDKLLNVNWQEKFENDGSGAKHKSADTLIGSYLDVPVGQEINSSG